VQQYLDDGTTRRQGDINAAWRRDLDGVVAFALHQHVKQLLLTGVYVLEKRNLTTTVNKGRTVGTDSTSNTFVKRIDTHGMVYRGDTVVAHMHLTATVARDGTVFGTIANTHHVAYPPGHPVPGRLTMLHPAEPKLRMPLDDGSIVEFHIASTLGSLVHARRLPPA